MRQLAVIAALLVAACGSGTASTPDQQSEPDPITAGAAAPSASPTTAPTSSPTPGAGFEPIELMGEGDSVPMFTVPERPAIADITHVGERLFAVEAIDPAGELITLLATATGDYTGTVLFDEEADSYTAAFQVTADGPWTITIKPVSSAPTWDPSSPLEGISDNVYLVSPTPLGRVTLDITNEGERLFAVTAYTSNNSRELLVAEVGNYSGQVLLPSGTVLITITADGGSWTLTPG